MVATAHRLATDAGLEILRDGGNAVDAAVAAAYAIGVVEPHASGIGGEGAMLIHLVETSTTVVIDFKSQAPLAPAPPDPRGYAAAAVPGAVAGLGLALRDYGSRPLKDVVAPAIRLAEQGFEASPGLAAAVLDHFEEVLADPGLAGAFCRDGLPIEAGAPVRLTELASTLRAIASAGDAAFYDGPIAEAVARAAAAGKGLITRADLAAYRPLVRRPLRGDYRGCTVITTPGPTGGLAILQNLGILARLDGPRASQPGPLSIHIANEVYRRGLADYRRFVGDPAFVRIPAEGLLSDAYLAARAAEIRPSTIAPEVEAGEPSWESPSTTALVVVDPAGNMVALTQTISDQFGARVMVPGTGIILNSEMRNFSRQGVNAWGPGKRPRTSIAPTLIMRGGRPFVALATPGSTRIVSTTTSLIVSLVDYGTDLEQAVEAPRFFGLGRERRLQVEDGYPEETLDALRRLGYQIEVRRRFDPFFGGAQAVMIDATTGARIGVADRRRDGVAAGF